MKIKIPSRRGFSPNKTVQMFTYNENTYDNGLKTVNNISVEDLGVMQELIIRATSFDALEILIMGAFL